MTCGICDPEAFEESIGTHVVKGRVFGYSCSSSVAQRAAVRNLYFYGAEIVFWDMLTKANVLTRPDMKLLLVAARKGDVVVLASDASLGQSKKAQDAHTDHLIAPGLSEMVLRQQV